MERYAVYFAPPAESALGRFGAAWLGWDAATGQSVPRGPVPGFSTEELDRCTEAPRRYGFHGTLKPPFRLADGTAYDDLRAAVVNLAADLSAVDIGRFMLKRLGGFLAIVPREKSVGLQDLAGRCVSDLDRFRAPASPEELARRRKRSLSPRQDAYLQQWGYPYVFEEFRFHLTLTNSLEEPGLQQVEKHLSAELAPVLEEPVTLADLCVFGDPGNGQSFRLVERVPIGVL